MTNLKKSFFEYIEGSKSKTSGDELLNIPSKNKNSVREPGCIPKTFLYSFSIGVTTSAGSPLDFLNFVFGGSIYSI